jgi:hypothetical protein
VLRLKRQNKHGNKNMERTGTNFFGGMI